MKRRWKAVIGAVIIAIAGAGGAHLYFSEYEPDRTRFPVRGIDVSHHQGAIDWTEVARDGVGFAYVKVSEGGDHRDRQFRRNIAEANRLGLPVGAYHYFTFCRPGADQANNFVEAVRPGVTQLPPVVDLEFDGNCDRRPSPDDLRREVETFIGTVETRLDRDLVYYAPDDFLEVYGDVLPPRPLWRRSILQEPGSSDWMIWQYHPAGRVGGIEGDVDLNVLSIGLDELIAFGRHDSSAEERGRR
jgi:lysozyme